MHEHLNSVTRSATTLSDTDNEIRGGIGSHSDLASSSESDHSELSDGTRCDEGFDNVLRVHKLTTSEC
jgi:hypothetical protein